MKTALIPFVALAALTALAEKQPFERYQSIVDRQMFGPLPPGFDPTKMPSEAQKPSVSEKELTQEQEKLQSSIHFSAINVTPEGVTAVGFTDNSDPKAPVHYYLKVGEKRNGWEVKEADPVAATMTIAKGEIEVALSLGGNSAKDGGTSKAGKSGKGRANRFGVLAGGLRKGPLVGGNSLLAKRKQRLQAEAEAKAEEDAAAAEKEAERQAQEAEAKAQREAERAEQRQQLMAIQEELRRVREAKAAAKSEEPSESESNEDN